MPCVILAIFNTLDRAIVWRDSIQQCQSNLRNCNEKSALVMHRDNTVYMVM